MYALFWIASSHSPKRWRKAGIRKEPGKAWRRNSERRSYADCASVTISIPGFAAKRRARQYAIQKQEHAHACSFLYRFKPELVALAEGEGFVRTSDARTE